MSLILEQVFDAFTTLIRERERRGSLNKEDAVRYSFFHALVTTGGIHPADIHLETLHTGFEGRKEIDMMIPPTLQQEGLLIEFKYDRRPENTIQNATDRAASVVWDLHRLSRFEIDRPWRRLFIYVTDLGMHTYFKNIANGFAPLYTRTEAVALGPIVQARLDQSNSKTFAKKFEGHAVTSSAQLLRALDPGKDGVVAVRMFEAFPGDPA